MTQQHVIVTGINHHTASLARRSHYAWNTDQQAQIYAALKHNSNITQYCILVTCNRTEIICTTSDASITVLSWLQQFITEKHSYQHINQAATQHILRTLCGLDSMLIGETEILGQYKNLVKTIQCKPGFSKTLSHMINHLIASAKRIRRESQLQQHSSSIAKLVIHNAHVKHPRPHPYRWLLIGAGTLIQQHLKWLQHYPQQHITLVCRNPEKHQALTEKYPITMAAMTQLSTLIPQHDFVISATSAPYPILTAAFLRTLAIQHTLFIDLAVPPDIEKDANNPHLQCMHLDEIINNTIPTCVKHKTEQAAKAQAQTHFQQFLLTQQSTTIAKFRALWFQQAHSIMQQHSTQIPVEHPALAQQLNLQMQKLCQRLNIPEQPKAQPNYLDAINLQRYIKQLAHQPTLAIKQNIRANKPIPALETIE